MPYRGLPSTDHKVDRENDEIGCALVSERVPSKCKEKFKEKEKVMSAETQQQNQDYVAAVEALQANGEWVVVARAVDNLENLAEWASNGVGADSSRSYDAINHFSPESTVWMDEFGDLVTDEKGNVVEPADDMYAPYGYLHWGEAKGSDEMLVAKAKDLAGSGARLLRVYPGVGRVDELSEEDIQEIIEDDKYCLVLAHPEPLEYSVENVATYIRYAFGLDDEKERLMLVPAAESEDTSRNVMHNYRMKLDFGGGLSKEEEEDWDRVTELYSYHPYARKDPWL